MCFSVPPSGTGSSRKAATLVAVPTSSPSHGDRLQPQKQATRLLSERLVLDSPSAPCPHCGGSGMLRTNVQSHRTCLECLGGGQRLLTSADLLRGSALRAVASSSVAG